MDLADSGRTITLLDDLGAPVTGTRHGCIVRQKADDLQLVCFPVVDGALDVTTTPLGIPQRARDGLAAFRTTHGFAPVQQRPWSMAASDRWIVFFSGTSCAGPSTWSLHVAPFDAEADALAGPWRTTTAPTPLLCLGWGVVAVVGDVLVASDMTTRLSACAPTEWLAGTLRERALGSPVAWTVTGDVLVLLDLLAFSGPDPPGRIIATRVLW